jgi:hypothetical protein
MLKADEGFGANGGCVEGDVKRGTDMKTLTGLGIDTDGITALPGPGESCDAIGLARRLVAYAMAISAKYVDIGPSHGAKAATPLRRRHHMANRAIGQLCFAASDSLIAPTYERLPASF